MSRGLGGVARALLAGALATGAAGCSDYLDRRDTLTLGTGDAVQRNLALHVIDPWPRRAASVDPTTSGERAQRAIERYRNPSAGTPAPTASAGFGAGSGAAATPSAPPVAR